MEVVHSEDELLEYMTVAVSVSNESGVDATIIELDSLPDPIRPPAKNNHLGFLTHANLVVPARNRAIEFFVENLGRVFMG